MKKIILLAFTATALFSACKKKNDTPKTCDVTVARIAGNYKITRIELLVNGTPSGTDVLANYLDPCERDDIYQLKADKTLIYQDAGTLCSPTSAGTGTWDITGGKLRMVNSGAGIDINSGTVNNYCTNFTADDNFGGLSIRYTFTKQ